MRWLLIAATGILLFSCSPKISTTVVSDYKPTQRVREVQILEVSEPKPEKGLLLAHVETSHNSQTKDCGYEDMLWEMEVEAKSVGGNVVHLTKVREPRPGEECYTFWADIYLVQPANVPQPKQKKEQQTMLDADEYVPQTAPTVPQNRSERKTSSTKTNYSITGFGSWAYRVAPLSDALQGPTRELYEGLKSGVSYGVSLGYFLNTYHGIGLRLHQGYYHNSISGTFYDPNGTLISGDWEVTDRISFIGAGYLVRFEVLNRDQLELGAYMGYGELRSLQFIGGSFIEMEGANVNIHVEANYNIALNPHLFLNLKAGFQMGAITSARLNNGYNQTTLDLLEQPESLHQVMLGGGLNFRF